MHTAIAVRRYLFEQLLGKVERDAKACWAGIVDNGLVRVAVVVDFDGLTALGIVVWVWSVLHYTGGNSDEILAIVSLPATAARAYGNIVISDVAGVCRTRIEARS